MDAFPSGHDQCRSIITVTGDIDFATADDLLLRLTALIGSARRDIGLDLSGVTYINSAGLRALTAVHARVSANGARLRLTRMSPVVVRFLEIVNAIREPTPPASTAVRVPSGPARREATGASTSEHTTTAQYANLAA